MTEELKQKLEKRFEKWFRKYLLCCDCKKKCTCIDLNAYCEEQIKQAYIAGATENGIQWHDLRKDPNDLPKKNKSYWVYMDCQGNKIYRSIVWQGCWCGWNGVALAWCEEPLFKE